MEDGTNAPKSALWRTGQTPPCVVEDGTNAPVRCGGRDKRPERAEWERKRDAKADSRVARSAASVLVGSQSVPDSLCVRQNVIHRSDYSVHVFFAAAIHLSVVSVNASLFTKVLAELLGHDVPVFSPS